MRVAVVIPIRSFSTGKARLADVLDAATRADLGERLASRVRDAARDLPCYVVTRDDDVRAWARATAAIVVDDPGTGLDDAVRAGVDMAIDRGASHVVVAHADLPRARSLAWTADFDGVTIVTDRRGDGTNVLTFPATASFEFAYGPGSCAKHVRAAQATGARVRVIEDDDLAWDIDEPADLAALGPGLALPPLGAENPRKH